MLVDSKKSKGFTLIELLSVVAIIAILTTLAFSNYRAGDQVLSLQRSTHKLAQDLRRAQSMAVSAKEFNEEVPAGYGMYFDLNQPNVYILFADLNDDLFYSGAEEKVEEITLESQVELIALAPSVSSALTIVFSPPTPSVFFTPEGSLIANINLSTGSSQMNVYVNKAGLIYID
jgi:prepilin-type N-terminal cleavage/methylation domain-containing protein